MKPTYVIEALEKRHDRSRFKCGESALDDFIRRYARQNDDRGLGRTYVAVVTGDTLVRGFYTISSGSVTFEYVPEKLPRYPVPVVHLGRLAVDESARGYGLGAHLLVDALRRAAEVADQLGIFAVEVHAKTPSVRAFYLKFGFSPLLDDELHLYLPVRTIRKLRLSDPS